MNRLTERACDRRDEDPPTEEALTIGLLDAHVVTTRRTSVPTFPPSWSASASPDGRIEVTGTIALNAGRQLQMVTIGDPPALPAWR